MSYEYPDYPEQEGELRELIRRFSDHMLLKLLHHRHKGGPRAWRFDSPEALLRRIDDERTELAEAIRQARQVGGGITTPEQRASVRKEAADVANFAMMVADLYREPGQ